MDNKFVKLVELVDKEFTVERVFGYKWKMWDEANRKMLVSDSYQQGYRKVYQISTDKGTLDISSNQYANMLEAVSQDGEADVNHRTFAVKSNGKTGMDIRYYINAVRQSAKTYDDTDSDDLDLASIGF